MTLIFCHFPAQALAAALAILPVFGWGAGVQMSLLTRDPTEIALLPADAGVPSDIGVLAWACGFFVAALAAAWLDARGELTKAADHLRSIALLTMVLRADEFFLVPENLPISEVIFFGVYALCFAATLIRSRRTLLSSPYAYAVLAARLLGGSLAVDLIQEQVEVLPGDYRILLEDGAKFLGAVTWRGDIWRTALAFNTAPLPAEQTPAAARVVRD